MQAQVKKNQSTNEGEIVDVIIASYLPSSSPFYSLSLTKQYWDKKKRQQKGTVNRLILYHMIRRYNTLKEKGAGVGAEK